MLRVVSLFVDGVVVLSCSLLVACCAVSFLRRPCRLYFVVVCCVLFVVFVPPLFPVWLLLGAACCLQWLRVAGCALLVARCLLPVVC